MRNIKYILIFLVVLVSIGVGIRILINKHTEQKAEKTAETTKGAIKGAPKGMVLVGFPAVDNSTVRNPDMLNAKTSSEEAVMVTKPKTQIDHEASVVATKPKVVKKVMHMRKHVSAVTPKHAKPKHAKRTHLLAKTLKPRRSKTSAVSYPIAYAFVSQAKHKIFRLKPGGKPLLRTRSPKELASMIEKSLSVDPKGNTHLNERRCKKYGECATAYSYFYGIRTVHPEVAHRLRSIIDLPEYLRSLKKTPAPKGKWVMSRVIVSYDAYGNVVRRYDTRGFARAFKHGEYAWCDIVSHKPILAGSCGNVVGKRYFAPAPAKVRNVALQPKPKNGRWERVWAYASELENPAPLHPAEMGYAEIRFYAYSGDTALIVPIFGSGLSERDFGIKRPGEEHFEPWSNAVCEENAPVICGFDALEGFTGKKVNRLLTGSFYLKTPGEYVLRVPRAFAEPATPDRVVLQLFHGKVAWPVLPARVVNPEVTARYEMEVRAYKRNHTDGLLVLPESYKHRIARVYYDLVEGAEHGSNLYFPRGQIKSAQQE
ncbi:MAG TPA: hypothetical protein ENJ75_01585 [Candidatus Kaiserbacteria bacterium]|nr:hypothetical protein [Candidatus Kaiserbacteria bacterium]